MRKIFIDGGGNNGNSIEMFLRQYPNSHEFEIYSFEPHPQMFKQLATKKSNTIKVFEQALSDQEGVADFFLSSTPFGSTLNSSKTTGRIGESGKISVKTVDLSKFISENFKPDDFIILKLDIEGGEYPVLSQLLRTGVVTYINKLYGEWHQHKLKNVTLVEHNKLVEDLKEIELPMLPWDALSKDFVL
jgi:FkbM family methyltransferase